MMQNITVYLAADHAGFVLKNHVRDALVADGYTVQDAGAYTADPQDDYPEIIARVMVMLINDIVGGRQSRGIIFGNSGQGEAIVANKFRGVRAAVYYGAHPDILTLSREHNNANVLSLGAGFLDRHSGVEAARRWMETAFSEEERHMRRVRQISKLEDHQCR